MISNCGCDFTSVSSSIKILDLGSGWTPAVLEYEEELAFIRDHLSEMDDLEHYFIGGSTNHASFDAFEYSDYITNRSGKIHLPFTHT